MEELIKDLNNLFTSFFSQEAGNRLSEFAWVSFKETAFKIIRDSKAKKETK